MAAVISMSYSPDAPYPEKVCGTPESLKVECCTGCSTLHSPSVDKEASISDIFPRRVSWAVLDTGQIASPALIYWTSQTVFSFKNLLSCNITVCGNMFKRVCSEDIRTKIRLSTRFFGGALEWLAGLDGCRAGGRDGALIWVLLFKIEVWATFANDARPFVGALLCVFSIVLDVDDEPGAIAFTR